MLNIINNAKNKLIKLSTNDNFVGKIKIKIYAKQKYIMIKIADNGGEISEKVKEHIFEPFFTTKDGGTGYGLYMAKEIIETRHNGKIGVKNHNDSVVFFIKIPKKIDNENSTFRR